jgi:predicted small lipoprotein YifL
MVTWVYQIQYRPVAMAHMCVEMTRNFLCPTSIIDLSSSAVDKMKRLSIVVAALLFIIAGCGQSGPLYISGNPSKIQEPPPVAESTADEEQKEDGDVDADADKE